MAGSGGQASEARKERGLLEEVWPGLLWFRDGHVEAMWKPVFQDNSEESRHCSLAYCWFLLGVVETAWKEEELLMGGRGCRSPEAAGICLRSHGSQWRGQESSPGQLTP